MKKKTIIIITITLLLLVACTSNKSGVAFKKSYESLNGVVNSNGKLSHKNYGMVKLDDDVIINKIFDIVVDKKKVNPKASSSNNMSNMRIFPAPPGWQEEMKRREEQYERQKQAEEAGELIEALFAIGFIIYLIYLFCK